MSVPSRFQVKAVGVSFRPGYPDTLHELAAAYAALPRSTCRACGGAYEHESADCTVCGGRGWVGAPGEASLVRDETNEHDPNAVAVLANGEHVGYLPRELAARVGPEIDRGARFRVTSAEVLVDPDHADRPGLLLRVERVQEDQQ